MRSAATSALCLALLGTVSFAPRASAHVVTRGIGTAIVLTFQNDKVTFTYDLGYGAIYARNTMLTVDTDRDFVVSDEEANRYLEDAWEKMIRPALRVKLDGREMPYHTVAKHSDNLAGEIAALPFDLYYDIEVEIPYASREERRKIVRLEIINEALKNQSTNVPLFYIPYAGHTNEVQFEVIEPTVLLDLQMRIAQGEALTVDFDFAMGDRLKGQAKFLLPGESPSALVTDPPSPGTPDRPETGPSEQGEGPARTKPPIFVDDTDEGGPSLEAFVQDFMKPGVTLWVMITLLFTAFFYGMGHALTPGHGKAMVAAYLVGTKGRIRDAVILGSVTTFTHTFSIFLLGIVIYVVLQGTSNTEVLKNWTVAGFSLLGCLILVVMGLVLFARRWPWAGHPERMQEAGEHHQHGLFGHGHGHAHEHGHGHGHGHGGGTDSADDVHHHDQAHAVSAEEAPEVAAETDASTPRLGELLTLGIASGIAPCPGGMYIIGLGLLYPERFLFALLLILVFCAGLGAVLIAIGIVLVTGRAHLLRRFGGRGQLKFISYLPAVSALFVAGVGSFFMVVYFFKYKPEIASMLSAFSEWLRAS